MHLIGILQILISMEGIETATAVAEVVPALPPVDEPQITIPSETAPKDDDINTKKRKENPVQEEEALEEARAGRPTRSKAAKLGAADSPHSSIKEAREEAKLKKEEEKRKKEEAKEEERKKKEDEKKAKEDEKQRRLDEKKAKDEEREAAKKAKDEEKAKKDEEKKAKEEEKRKAKESAEAEKLAKEEERKRLQKAKDDEKAKKEEEKKAKEDAREEARRQKEEEKKSKEVAARRQSSMLLSFVKKIPSEANISVDSKDSEATGASSSAGADDHRAVAKFEQVGKFLAWMPPAGVVVAPFQKWTTRATELEFEQALEKSNNGENTTSWLDSRRFAAPRPTLDEIRTRRDASYATLARFQKTSDDQLSISTPALDRQRKHMVAHKTKVLQIDESARPVFFGTYSTTSPLISGRKWKGKDASIINYDLNSDEEDFGLILDDEEDLEAASNASDEEGSEQANEYEYDAFVVPDGTLSEDEALGLDSDDEGDEIDPSRAKARSELLAQNKRKAVAPERSSANRTPILTGLVYDLGSLSSNAKLTDLFTAHTIRPASSATYNKIQANTSNASASVTATAEQLWWPVPLTASISGPSGANAAATVRKSTARVIPTSLVPEVAKFVQNEFESSFERLLEKVRDKFTQASKKQLALFIREKCEKKKLPTAKAGVWLVKSIHRESLALPLEDPIPPPPPATTLLVLEKSTTTEGAAEAKPATTPKKARAKKAPSSQPSIASPQSTSTNGTSEMMDIKPTTIAEPITST